MSGQRLDSLDVYRGLAVMAMMMVDWPGSWNARYAVFEHARWNGITIADFIFPCFILIMGVAIVFSLGSARGQGGASGRVYWRIGRRAIVLFLAGYFLNLCWQWKPGRFHFSEMRLLGVLQRFALVYPIVSIAYLQLSRRALATMGVFILVGYWALMTLVPVPGFGPPDLDRYPEGETVGNLATWLDKTVLGTMTARYPHDPEGILSTVPALVTAVVGVLAGEWLRSDAPIEQRIGRILGWGVVLTVVGRLWGVVFPLNKNLWTSSFVLVTGGVGLLLLGGLLWLLDVRRKGAKLFATPRAFGANALAAMVGFTFINAVMRHIPAGLTAAHAPRSLKAFLFERLFQTWLSDRNGSWVFSVVAIALLAVPFKVMHRRGWLLRA